MVICLADISSLFPKRSSALLFETYLLLTTKLKCIYALICNTNILRSLPLNPIADYSYYERLEAKRPGGANK